MYRTRLAFGAVALALALGSLGTLGCGAKPGGKVPTAHPMVSFTAPEEDEVFPEDDGDDDGDDSSDGE